jgi:hypothetical protein
MGRKKRDVYDVEAIVSKRINGDIVEYRVKWFNYTEDQNTWEPIDHLNCKDLIDQYEQQHKGEEVERLALVIEPGNGFDKNWHPIKVFGATKRQSDGKLMIVFIIYLLFSKLNFEFNSIN